MPWTRKRTSPSFARLLLEDADELLADDLALLLGIVDAREPREEALLRLHVHERHVEVAVERLDDLLRLVLAQQAVVDEDARELVADRLVHEQRRDGGVDAAARARRARARCRPARGCARPAPRSPPRRPRRRRAGDLVEEVLQQVLPVRRVHDLGVELDAVQPARRLPRTRRPVSRARRATTRGALGRRGRPCRDGSSRRSARPAGRRRARPPQRSAPSCRTRRRPCARPGRRARAPSAARRSRCRASGCRASKTPGSIAARRRRRPRPGRRERISACGLRARTRSAVDRVRDELRVDARFAHAPRDQLRVLAAEVETRPGAPPAGAARAREQHLSAGSSAPPS